MTGNIALEGLNSDGMNTVQYRSVTSKDDKSKMFMSDGDLGSEFKVK